MATKSNDERRQKLKASKPVISSNLATKYRPMILKDLVGQKDAKAVVGGMINTRSYPKAILISGPSGCGKTTLARLINRYVNCDTGDACGVCESCTRIKHPDLVEYNVGDTRGVDDIRNIMSSSKYMPKYNKRIMLLDEVHALTSTAATAFLVPLEDTSKDTIFILATTNPEKIMGTIKGRCMHIPLRPISPNTIAKRLYRVAKLEGVDFNDVNDGVDTLELIASLTNGQMRDALQTLEVVMKGLESGQNIEVKDIVSSYVRTFDLNVDKRAADLVHSALSGNFDTSIKHIIGAEDPRQLVGKARWLINYLLAERTDNLKMLQYSYRPISVLQFEARQKKLNADASLEALVMLQSVFTQTELIMNSAPIDETVVMYSGIGEYILKVKQLKIA